MDVHQSRTVNSLPEVNRLTVMMPSGPALSSRVLKKSLALVVLA